MTQYYHGTNVPGISVLKAQSGLHGADKKVVYLTDSVPYALFYIWDAAKHGCRDKHVTGWVKDGIAYYEEQFPDQLKAFYQGACGYLYTVRSSTACAVKGRPNLFYSEADTPVSAAMQIPDVYAALLDYEAKGELVVLRYAELSKARQAELIDLIASDIRQARFYADDPAKRDFMQRHFKCAWQKAVQM